MTNFLTPATDFSSATYWSSRFETERSIGFEWLVPSSVILPIILSQVNSLPPAAVLRVLHFGCGTSSLGSELANVLSRGPSLPNQKTHIVDSDYVDPSLLPTSSFANTEYVTYSTVQQDLLSPTYVLDPEERYDLLIDKSTADAISCGPIIGGYEPIQVLCTNLASFTKPGGRWISISYSENRFPASILGKEWTVLERQLIDKRCLPGGRIVKENGVERRVYEPETGIWCYVLERQ
ncbi:hypothetical protein P7C73_g5107, partial [Tremellales sp. Uapishka_1]